MTEPADKPREDQIIKALEDLLTIALVAMPAELFAVDERVIKAQAVLAKLKGEVQ